MIFLSFLLFCSKNHLKNKYDCFSVALTVLIPLNEKLKAQIFFFLDGTETLKCQL